MRCSQVHNLSSTYLDGELDEARSSAFRGHLRTCDSCADIVAKEQAIARAAGELASSSSPNLEPSPELWARIGARLAEEEIADAAASPFRLRLRSLVATLSPYRVHVAGAFVLAAVAALLVVNSRYQETLLTPRPQISESAAKFAPSMGDAQPTGETHLEAAMREIHRADKRYLTAIGELRDIAAEERSSWGESAKKRFDRTVHEFEAAAKKMRAELGEPEGGDVRARDPLYKLYKRHIKWLENVVFDQVSAVGGLR